MRHLSITKAALPILLFVACFLTLVPEASAQRTRSRTSPPANEVRAAAEAVSVQVKNLSKFLFVLGGVARGIEDIDKEIQAGRASRELQQQNRQFKDDVLRSIRALRAGLVKLEVDFRAKPELRPYLPQLQGITDDSGVAEDLALSGQFTASGRELLNIMEKLADALVELPPR